MRTQGILLFIAVSLAAIVVLAIWTPPVDAYTQWSIADDATNCGECHGDFRSSTYISPVDGQLWGNLHNIHRTEMLNSDCEVCHGEGDRFPVLLNESLGGIGFDPISCTGCHNGRGLRLHHTNAQVPADQGGTGSTCLDCHGTEPAPPAENVLPPYYFTPDPAHPDKPTDPCNPAPDFPEHFAGLTLALDNDGDLAYDELDSECGIDIFTDGFESGDTSAWGVVVP